MKTKVTLLFILLVFAFTPTITILTTTYVILTINIVSLAKATNYNVIFGISLVEDPIDSLSFPY